MNAPPECDDRRRMRIIAALMDDDIGQAALDLYIERGRGPPGTYVTPETYQRLAADAAGREALRIVAERIDLLDE